ncbi:hypothetical protein DB345_07370 [Spartobacteria bacterium LR76]|nr:hypothetical protein DB345_07370 [Spartobacteria bacterium LR76]
MEKTRQADWLAWSLQYLAGLIVGAVIGVASTGRRHNLSLLAPDLLFPAMGGAALIGAGLASLLGDQLWMGSSYKVIPPDAPSHSLLSKTLSFLSMGVGAMLIVLTLFANFTRYA